MKILTFNIAILLLFTAIVSTAHSKSRATDPYFAIVLNKPVVKEVVKPLVTNGMTALRAEITYQWNCNEYLVGVVQSQMQVAALGNHIELGVLVENNGISCKALSHPVTITTPLPYGNRSTTFLYIL